MAETETRVAVVTGAGRGIGLASVRALAGDGFTVVGGSRTVTEELRAHCSDALAVDVATAEGPGALVQHAVDRHGGIDVLVNTVAGVSTPAGGFLELDDDAWWHTVHATLMPTVRVTRAALPTLLSRRGAVINISSINARMPQPRLVAQSALKAAVTNLGAALTAEFAAQGLRVNTVSPGPVWTDVWLAPGGPGESLARARGIAAEAVVEQLPAELGVPTGRFAEATEVASVVAFLASRKAANMSGADLVIDGGMSGTA